MNPYVWVGENRSVEDVRCILSRDSQGSIQRQQFLNEGMRCPNTAVLQLNLFQWNYFTPRGFLDSQSYLLHPAIRQVVFRIRKLIFQLLSQLIVEVIQRLPQLRALGHLIFILL